MVQQQATAAALLQFLPHFKATLILSTCCVRHIVDLLNLMGR